MCNNPNTHENCEKCLGGHYINCIKGKCIHGSIAKSLIGFAEAEFWKVKGTYKYIDKIICCSYFLKTKLDTNPVLATKTIVMHNFIDKAPEREVQKEDYILYFGRYSWEKGVRTLIEAAKMLPEITFVFAGKGEYADKIRMLPNAKDVGFKTGDELDELIRRARFSICPSEWYENCPFSVMESQDRHTPVIGANIGGIPELIENNRNGLLFESGNADLLSISIKKTLG